MFRFLGKISRRAAKPGSLFVLAAGLVIGAIVFGSIGSFMVYANSEKFCAESCHEMKVNVAAEYKGTIHDTNRSGVRAVCSDCHVPHDYIPNYLAKLGLFSDVWGHFVTGSIDTKEKFEAKRYELAKRVWLDMKANDSRECRHCHTTTRMDPEKQSAKAQARHEKARAEGLTCIDCHFAISHTEPNGPGPQELSAGARTAGNAPAEGAKK
jgi:cytochrome c-type protein NapC